MVQHRFMCWQMSHWRQFTAAIIINLAAINFGMLVLWPALTTPQLLKENPPVGTEPMTQDQTSWLSSVSAISSTLTGFISTWMAEKFGRLKTGCFIAVPATMSWLFILFAQNFYHLLISRLLAGVSFGLTISLIAIYVSEISDDSVKGILGSFLTFSINIGNLLSAVLGAKTSYSVFAICGLVVPLLFFVTFIFMPETPMYLIRKGDVERATKSLMWLENNDREKVDSRLTQLQDDQRALSSFEKSRQFKDLFRDRGTIMGFVIAIFLIGGQQTSGTSIVDQYTVIIFELANTSLSPTDGAIVVTAMHIVGSWLATITIGYFQRRTLLVISCLMMMSCHILFGIFFLLQSAEYDLSFWSWLPLVALSGYTVAYGMGLGPLAFIIAVEVLRPDIATLAMAMAMVVVNGLGFITVKVFPFVTTEFGNHMSFFILAGFCALTLLFTIFVVPETKGRSVVSTYELLNRKKSQVTDNDKKIDDCYVWEKA